MICKACGQDAVRLRVTWEKDKQGRTVRTDGCNYCLTHDNAVLLFNYEKIGHNQTGQSDGARKVRSLGVSAAHIRDIRSRKIHSDFTDQGNPTFEFYRDRGRVSFDMGRR